MTRIATIALAGLAVLIGGCGTSGSETPATKKAEAPAKVDCGSATPQDAAGIVNAYLDGPGAPVVAGTFDCRRVAKLWAAAHAAQRRRGGPAPYIRVLTAAEKQGWVLIDSEDPRWRGVKVSALRSTWTKASGDPTADPLFVFVRPANNPQSAVIFNDLEP